MLSFSLLLLVCAATAELFFDVPKWTVSSNKALLGDSVVLFWTKFGCEITFEVHARARGYVAIGVSPSGGMPGSDVALGWVNGTNSTLLDMFAPERKQPLLDSQQDLVLHHAEEVNGVTALHFSRHLRTNDTKQDVPITADTLRVIWAFSDQDPTSSSDVSFHGKNCGVRTLHLVENIQESSSNKMPDDVQSYDFTMPNVTIPVLATTMYWCQAFPVPRLGQKHHVIKFSRILHNPEIVHHLIAYACYHDIPDKTRQKIGYYCHAAFTPDEFADCREPVFAWAIGGEAEFSYPPDVGVSLGGPNDPKFFVLEIHYNNDNFNKWVDRSGFRIWYTPTLRKYDVGSLMTGSVAQPTQIIPPNSKFTTYSICAGHCLDNSILGQPKGIHLFTYLLHSHLLGRKIRVRHLREGIQIGWLGKDEFYDFNYQQTRLFTEERTILPGDKLITECVYDSIGKNTVTFGGYSTSEEMCAAFFQYYPRVNTATCSSAVWYTAVSHIIDGAEVAQNGTVLKPSQHAGKYFTEIFDKAKWNSSMVYELQKEQTRQPHTMFCQSANGVELTRPMSPQSIPFYDQMEDEYSCSVGAQADRISLGVVSKSSLLLLLLCSCLSSSSAVRR